MTDFSRRTFTKALMLTTAAAAVPRLSASTLIDTAKMADIFKPAMTTWSFYRELFKGSLKATEVPGLVKTLGIDTLEWTAKTFRPLSGGREQMFQAPPPAFFHELRKASDDSGVTTHVMNTGGPLYLASKDTVKRQKALEFYLQYVEPAQLLGAKIMRAELYTDLPHGPGREAEAKKLAMAGLHALLDKTADSNLIINVENHHGISSQPEWLADLIRSMNNPRLGLTVDTNNFRIDEDMPYEADPDALPRYVDRYHGLEILMPLANWVSAKTYTFDSTGYEISLDYPRILQIMLRSGYTGPLAIEYEGNEDPKEGVRKSVDMFRRLKKHINELK